MTLQSHDRTRWPSRLRIIVGILDRVSRMNEHAGPVDSACDLSEVGIAVVGLTKLQWFSLFSSFTQTVETLRILDHDHVLYGVSNLL